MAPRKTWNRRLALAGGAVLAGAGYLALRGGNSAKPHSQLPDARTLRRGNGAEPQTLDPSLATGAPDDFIIGDLMTALMTEDALARPVPGMAQRWTTSPDGLIWTFTLREALWSDGVPVTADDFVFSWRRLLDPATAAPYAYYLYILKNGTAVNTGKLPASTLGVKALDSHTLEMTLEHPAPYLLEMLMHSTTHPLPRHVIAAKGKDWTRPGNYVGNGAFVLKKWIPNEYVLLEKNPHFYEAAAVALERVYFYPTDDYAAAMQRMRAGELDTQDRLPPQQIKWVKAHMPEAFDPSPWATTEYLEVNHRRKPFDDVRVRAAIDMALNRDVIAGRVMQMGNLPAYTLVPPGTDNFPGGNKPDFLSLAYPQRIEKARALMREAGYSDNKRLTTTYMIRNTAPGYQRAVAAAIQQMFALVYINASILPTDFQVFLAQTHSHDFDIAEAGWSGDFNDAATFMELLQTSGGNNDGQYSNPAFDAMLTKAQKDPDLASRGRALKATEAIAMNDHALMPLYYWVNLNLVWPYVKGWHSNPTDKHRSRWVSIDQVARVRQFTGNKFA
jgi:oligopeptide transport system substrate-binding protein